MKSGLYLLITCWSVLFYTVGTSQSSALSFEFFREKDGLNNNTTYSSNCVLIDRHGFVWFATMSGLNRYDGYSIRSFQGKNSAPYDLPYSKIVAIAEDHHGTIWLGTMEEGIIRFDPRMETFTHFESEKRIEHLSFTQINRLVIHPDSSLIINTAFQGLYRYDIDRDVMVRIKVDPDNHTDRSMNNITVLRDGRLVVLAYNGVYLQLEDQSFQHFPISTNIFVSRAIEMPDGVVQVYAQNLPDYYVLDPERRTLTKTKSDYHQTMYAVLMDPEKGLWRSLADGRLIREKPNNSHRISRKVMTNINDDMWPVVMLDMQADDHGYIYYMSGSAGAGRFAWKPGAFSYFQNGPKGFFKVFYEKKYLARSDSLFSLDEEGEHYIPLQAPGRERIFDYLIDRKGEYWVSHVSSPHQLIHYDTQGRRLDVATSPRFIFWRLAELQNGEIALGYRLSVQELEGKPYFSVTSHYEELSGNRWPDFSTKYFTELTNGDIWLASFASGIVRLTGNRTKVDSFQIDPAGNGLLNSNNPYYLFEGSDGLVYVATDKGINIWDPSTQQFSYFNHPDADLQDIKGMAEGPDGEIWILMRHQLMSYRHADRRFSLFQLHPDFRVSYADPLDLLIDENRFLYYQSIEGVVRVALDQLRDQPPPPDVLFTDLYINRTRVYPGDPFRVLDSSLIYQQHLEFPFKYRDVGFSFVSPGGRDVGATYYYRLTGYRDEWKKAPDDLTLHFTSLSPGHYSFDVRAQSAGGAWTSGISSIVFHIAAPWYERWWAYGLYALLLSAMAYSFYRYRINQLLKYQRLRTKISSDLHDDVGSILGSIAMESEMLAYQADNEKAPLLNRLSALSREAMGRMRDTVWAIDARKDSMEFLADRMKDYLAETLSNTKLTYTFEENIQNTHLAPDTRQNVYLIFKEAINNVLRHSSGDQVEVSLTRSGSRFLLIIRDNGQIIEPVNISGLGLSNMKMRAETIGGEVMFDMKDGFEVRLVW